MNIENYIDFQALLEMAFWKEIGIASLLFLAFLLFRKIFTKYIFGVVLRASKKANFGVNTEVLLAFEKPLRTFFIIIGLYLALNYLSVSAHFSVFILKVFRSSVIILIAWGVFNLTSSSSKWLESLGKKLDLDMDKIIVPFIAKVSRFVVVIFAGGIVLDVWEYDVNGFVAGLGLGGLAFALAAKDTIGNIFGGIVIITEKPFSLGDWIQTPSVEGSVEDITFRSTKVRTFAQALVTVPNSTLANEAITNWTRMGKRRITFHLGVVYSTTKEKMGNCVRKIRGMLQNHPSIDQQTIFVHFDRFNDSSLDIFLYFFTKTTNWGEWLEVKEDCNLKILEILEREGVSVAFPSTSVYFENELMYRNEKENL